jgi:hypothetical protein
MGVMATMVIMYRQQSTERTLGGHGVGREMAAAIISEEQNNEENIMARNDGVFQIICLALMSTLICQWRHLMSQQARAI